MKLAIVILNGISNFNYDCLSHSYRGWRVVHRNLHYNELEGINNLGDILVILQVRWNRVGHSYSEMILVIAWFLSFFPSVPG